MSLMNIEFLILTWFYTFCVIELWKRNYSFTGCDTTSKVGTKDKASKVASNKRHQYQLAKFA